MYSCYILADGQVADNEKEVRLKPLMNNGFEMYYRDQVKKILREYGPGEQGRLLIATVTLLTYLEPNEIPGVLSKSTYYRHIALLEQAGIKFTNSYYEKLRNEYKNNNADKSNHQTRVSRTK